MWPEPDPRIDTTDVVGERILAKLRDEILVGILAVVLATVADADEILLVFVGLLFPYHIVLEGLYGRTIGKEVMGVVVVDGLERPPGLRKALVRNLLRVIDGLVYYVVGLAVMGGSEKRQRIGDHAGGALVVKNRG